MANEALIGTAGWAIPRDVVENFDGEGSLLSRYARRFQAVEINSTFYRSHRPSTYMRWAASVPDEFLFSVKLPKSLTHELRLQESYELLSKFVGEVSELGSKLGVILIQLPPSLQFEPRIAVTFLKDLRSLYPGSVACEPRHPSWFQPAADEVLTDWKVARVAADPARAPEAFKPGGWPGLVYYRLHGSPRMYYSSYDRTFLSDLGARLSGSEVQTWCIFDNTASGAACRNALDLTQLP